MHNVQMVTIITGWPMYMYSSGKWYYAHVLAILGTTKHGAPHNGNYRAQMLGNAYIYTLHSTSKHFQQHVSVVMTLHCKNLMFTLTVEMVTSVASSMRV